MRICLFSRSDIDHPQSGGMETHGKLLTEGLVDVGHQVVIITTSHPQGLEKQVRNGVEIHYLRDIASGVYSREWWDRSVKKFSELHQKKSFDIVLSQSVAGWGYLRSKEKFNIPCVAIMHGTTFRDLKTRWVSVSSFGDFLRFLREASVRLWRYLFRWLYWFRQFDAIIAVSEAVRGSLIKNYFLDPKKVSLVYNGIAVEKFQIKDNKSQNRKTLLYLGRLDKDKGIKTLLEAMVNLTPHISHFRSLIVGDGSCYNDIYQCSKQLGLSDMVELVGRVPHEETPRYYRKADIFVYPSEALEGLPMTIIEAMAAGLPVVASKIGGIPEVVSDGETGILVEPGNAADLSRALKRLLIDEELRRRMGQRAHRVVKEKFSQGVMVKKTLEVLEKVLQ